MPVSPQQLPALEVLARASFTATFGHLYLAEHLQHHLDTTCSATYFAAEIERGNAVDVACADGELAGYIKYGAVGLPVVHGKADREIHRLYVRAGYQGQGIGRMLMDRALADTDLQAAPALFLGVWEHNHKAQAFYAGYGFEAVGEYLYHVGPHRDRELIMRRMSVN